MAGICTLLPSRQNMMHVVSSLIKHSKAQTKDMATPHLVALVSGAASRLLPTRPCLNATALVIMQMAMGFLRMSRCEGSEGNGSVF
jgi:hypothetical protein